MWSYCTVTCGWHTLRVAMQVDTSCFASLTFCWPPSEAAVKLSICILHFKSVSVPKSCTVCVCVYIWFKARWNICVCVCEYMCWSVAVVICVRFCLATVSCPKVTFAPFDYFSHVGGLNNHPRETSVIRTHTRGHTHALAINPSMRIE